MKTINLTAREWQNFQKIFKALYELYILQGVIYIIADTQLLEKLGY